MDGLRLALVVAAVAVVAVVYFLTARRRRIDREAGRFDRFDAWSDDGPDPLVDDIPDPYADRDELASSDDFGEHAARASDTEPGDLLDDVPPMPPGRVVATPPPLVDRDIDDAAPTRPAPSPRPSSSPAASSRQTPAATTPSVGNTRAESGNVLDGLEAIAQSLDSRDQEPSLGELSAVTERPLRTRKPAPESPPTPEPGRTPRRRTGSATKRSLLGRAQKEVQTELPLEPPPAEPEMVVVLNVMAADDGRFEGAQVHQTLTRAGLRYGDMQAYHFHESDAAPSLFSVLNAVSPGTLNPKDSEALRTPGLALVLTLPGPKPPIQCFETMHAVAERLAAELGGRICDASRSSLTLQAANHLREQITEYGRRKRLEA